MTTNNNNAGHDQWARLRFSVIGHLLIAPPARGELQAALKELSQREWTHPHGHTVRFAFSTIESWYYDAQSSDDPIATLRRKRRSDAGRIRSMSFQLLEALIEQYHRHPWWSAQLHHDNLVALVHQQPELGTMPSYATVRRALRERGLSKRRRTPNGSETKDPREILSYEMSRSHALWHGDFHHGKIKVLTSAGTWEKPFLLAFLDDYSRLVCHAQWYLEETAEAYVHCLSQAFYKFGLPRGVMSDNGSPMTAGESEEGLLNLGILGPHSEAYKPYQNGKIEILWASVEGRLMAMLPTETPLTLDELNTMTQIWVQRDYQRRSHREIATTPEQRFLDGPNAARPCPSVETVRSAFQIAVSRKVRRSDGTLSLDGVRFQMPAAWRHFEQVRLRYARWDLSRVDLIDPQNPDRTLTVLRPLDKQRNAVTPRQKLPRPGTVEVAPDNKPAPLLAQMLKDHAESNLPAGWLPFKKKEEDPS